MSTEWPFDQPPNCAVATTTHVMNDGALITHVFHDEDDDGWQFHYAGEKTTADLLLVCLKNVVALDDTLLEIADLPPGWSAMRESRGGDWKRIRIATESVKTDPLKDFGMGIGTTPTSIGGGLLKTVLRWFIR